MIVLRNTKKIKQLCSSYRLIITLMMWVFNNHPHHYCQHTPLFSISRSYTPRLSLSTRHYALYATEHLCSNPLMNFSIAISQFFQLKVDWNLIRYCIGHSTLIDVPIAFGGSTLYTIGNRYFSEAVFLHLSVNTWCWHEY